jgi:hypothetical protein
MVCIGVVDMLSLDVMNVGRPFQPPTLRFAAFPFEPTPHGIDLKKPFTMSKIGRAPIAPCLPVSTTGKSFSSSIGLGMLACALQEWWSLSGSNR